MTMASTTRVQNQYLRAAVAGIFLIILSVAMFTQDFREYLGRFSRMSLKSMSEAFDLRLMDVIEFSCGCVSVPGVAGPLELLDEEEPELRPLER